MLYSIKNRDDLENLYELILLQNKVKVLGLEDKLGTQTLHDAMKKVFQPVTDQKNIFLEK